MGTSGYEVHDDHECEPSAMINGSFVFGMDDDDQDVFQRTVDWAIEHGYHHGDLSHSNAVSRHAIPRSHGVEGRMLTRDWNLYDTRHVVYRSARLQP
jgi:hypothetical protein